MSDGQRTIGEPSGRNGALRATPTTTSSARRLLIIAAVVGGVLVGHAATYVLAVPDPHHRDLVLDGTGHGYLPAAAQLALVLAVAGIAAVFASAVASRSRAADLPFVRLLARLAAAQVVAFAGLEIVERSLAGAPLGDLVGDRLLVIGVAAQLGVAIVSAVAIRSLGRGAARLGEVVRARTVAARPATGTLAIASHAPWAPARVIPPADPIRGPPSR